MPRDARAPTHTRSGRHYGMDWLRIGAFALLILYHIGMAFVPWGWHVKWTVTPDWVQIPMMATNGWRLALLFVVSGYASAALLTKLGSGGAFLRSRTARLLIPLVYGIVVVVPPQPWIELMFKHGYQDGLAQFWAQDYFRFGSLEGIILPTWQHLWFVVYLWVYTLLFAMLHALLAKRAREAVARIFDRCLAGVGLLWVPLVLIGVKSFVLFPGVEDTHALYDDFGAHMVFLPMFLFGMGLRHAPRIWATIQRSWGWAALVSVLSYAGSVALFLILTGGGWTAGDLAAAFEALRIVQAWTAIVALIGAADRFLDRDAPVRPMLNEAIFPFYIIHQTIIVVVCWWLMPTEIGTGAAFAIILAATVAGCWLFYRLGREIPVFRLLIGLKGIMPPRVVKQQDAAIA